MKAEEVTAIGAVSGVGGYVANKFGIRTGNDLLDAGIGLALAIVGWFMDYDGVGDAVEGFGLGYFAGALV